MTIILGDIVAVRPKPYNIAGRENATVVGIAGSLVEVLTDSGATLVYSRRVSGKYLRVGTPDSFFPAQILVGDYPLVTV